MPLALGSIGKLNQAVEFLLSHWQTKKSIGPCHYGIGTLFMQVEYSFRSYNLFEFVYVLSFYEKARNDLRYLEALSMLQGKLKDQQIVVERVVPKLAKLDFCLKGQKSQHATQRYQEIINNMTQSVNYKRSSDDNFKQVKRTTNKI